MGQQTYRIAAEQRGKLVNALGWFSIGLGLLQILAPRRLSKFTGVQPHTGLMPLLGLREITAGVGILRDPQNPASVASRVAGDAMNLGLLGIGFLNEKSHKGRLLFATTAVAGVTALDILAYQDLKQGPGTQSRRSFAGDGAVHLRRSIIINRPREELYQIWRNVEQLPGFMPHLLSVQSVDENQSRWAAKGPAGSRLEWEAKIDEDRPNELISWRSVPNSDVDTSGSVQFEPAPGGRGTIVRVDLHYRPPAGKTGAWVAKLLGQSPEKQIAIDLLRFKQKVETGEIARTDGQPASRTRSTSRKYDDLVRA